MSRIDVHHHCLPPVYAEALKANGGDPSGWKTPNWSPESDKAICQKLGIRTAFLSVTAPGPDVVKGPESARIARQCNEWAAEFRDQDSQKYGFFASIPSPLEDLDRAISELSYALDVLHADGVTLFTRYGDGNYYLGHRIFRPLWDELNKRHAVVFIHPTTGVDIGTINPLLPAPMIEYPHETTRCAVDLVVSKRVQENPNCKIILCHSGGTLPFIAMRPGVLLSDANLSSMTLEEFLGDCRKFYYEVAQSSSQAIELLMKFADPDRVLYGCDYPYCPDKTIDFFTNALNSASLTQEQLSKINRRNALKLFPRLAEGE
ncbi:amidohydrolase 2 [Aspergillus japonicus CBS 114.51]|uniref:6-methylsalicylate decarboxylase n=1 Tax=Aspergillus japonicus CBS 114.51 TaxID=1448312 RepID=A0A8T8WRR3_ASPJA|nr:amidohydrolase 2 [Aspergillus japonicus CBS 114.51]RAH78360.1 amidohydrolase 2 [Aspergillus japonicus CBS 114.51]